ncbi:MAG: transposase [Chloroflexi bacterium]|nr:transposase [Chloroflexota bacterium]
MSPRSPWQNGIVERPIGWIRRECLDRVIVIDEVHLRKVLSEYVADYHTPRAHQLLTDDAPDGRPAEKAGRIAEMPMVGGLHHRYARHAA